VEYRLAKCCDPREGDEIIAFLKQDADVFSVHCADCVNMRKIPPDRRVAVCWKDIAASCHDTARTVSDALLDQLDQTDFAVLRHHRELGLDYAAVVARQMGIPRAEVFARHRKLGELGLLQRVQPRMIRYRKGIVDGKWIKHRNHTYYELTEKGIQVLDKWSREKL